MALHAMIYTPPMNWNSQQTGESDVVHLYVNDMASAYYDLTNINYTIGMRDVYALGVQEMIYTMVLRSQNHKPSVKIPGLYAYTDCESALSQSLDYR